MGIAEMLGFAPQQTSQGSALQRMAEQVLTPDGDQIANILMDRYGDPAVVAGIMGNIAVETGETYDYSQKQKGGDGEGLFQFTFQPMKDAYKKFLEKNKKSDSPESQIDFVQSAINGGKDYELGWRAREEIQNAIKTGDAETIAGVFSDKFEKPGRPHQERRLRSTRYWYNKLTQGGK